MKEIAILTTVLAAALVWSGIGSAEESAPLDPLDPYWSITQNRACLVWNHGAGDAIEPFTWSGACVDGKAQGYGLLTYRGGEYVFEGGMKAGRRHGHGIITSSNGYRYEGEFVNGQPRGDGTTTLVSVGRYGDPHRGSNVETPATTDFDSHATDIRSFRFACEMPDGRVLKPKFGDIAGASYADLPAQRQQCLETIDHKIALCRENTDLKFESENGEFAACLPIFEQQARACVSHFEFERGKCGIGASLSDVATRENEAIGEQVERRAQKVVSESSFMVEPLDRIMEVSEDANVRAGPGIDHAVLATLEAGAGVHVTGAVRGREWFRVQPLETGGAAFVHMSLVKDAAPGLLESLFEEAVADALEPPSDEVAVAPLARLSEEVIASPLAPLPEEITAAPLAPLPEEDTAAPIAPLPEEDTAAPVASLLEEDTAAPLDPFGLNWSITGNQHCHVWNYGETELEPFTWSGVCVDGKTSGAGRLTFLANDYVYEGTMNAGMMHGNGTIISSDGYRYEGAWDNGEPHGHGIESLASGEQYTGAFQEGKRYGYGIYTTVNGDLFEGEWRDGKPHGNGTYTNADGSVFEGQWYDGCIGERDGEWATIGTTPQACGFK